MVKVVVLSEIGNTSTVPHPHETWSHLCRRTLESSYLPALLPLLVRVHPSQKLAAYRLRYDGGLSTVVQPSWSTEGVGSDGVGEDADGQEGRNVGQVAGGYLDVNISLRPAPSRRGTKLPEFLPHEEVASSLAREGIEGSMHVRIYFEKLYAEGSPGGGPFPARKEGTRALTCVEHGAFKGYTDSCEVEKQWDGRLPGRCVNVVSAEGEGEDEEEVDEVGTASEEDDADGSDGSAASPRSKNARKKRKRKAGTDSTDAAKKSPAKSPAKKSPAKKSPATASPANKAAEKSPAKKSPAKKPLAKKVSDAASSPLSKALAAQSKPRAKAAAKIKPEEEDITKPSPPRSNGHSPRTRNVNVHTRVHSHPTDVRDRHLPPEPAGPDLPRGWVRRRVPRGAKIDPKGHTKTDLRYYSPKEGYRFLQKADAKMFVEKLKEARGDEREAMVLLKRGGRKAALAAAKGAAKQADEGGDAAAGKGAKKKRKGGDSAAVKRALGELEAGPPVKDESPKKKAKTTNVKSEEISEKNEKADSPGKKPKAKVTKAKAEETAGKKGGKAGGSPGKNAKKKKAKKEIDPNMPKRPPNSYLLFQKDARPKMASDHPELKHGEVLSKVGEAWKGMAESERKPYKDKADAALVKYKAELEAYKTKTV